MFVYTYPTLIQEGFKVANRGGKWEVDGRKPEKQR